ncbi:MAG: diaminopropionate ammonia-lyase [candidate division Zixibacteria bacterium]|nr:diaminopropionate ammonia-lyase [candidate division Zixibacteria bacterium]
MMTRFVSNTHRRTDPDWPADTVAAFSAPDISAVHRSLPEYRPTPLLSLPNLAHELGIGEILVKDESHRFGLKAFKALGSAYAIYRFVQKHLHEAGRQYPPADQFYRESTLPKGTFVFCTATDGNHGRGVAWIARKLSQRAVIYMPTNSARARIQNIRKEGAEVIVVDGTYDDAVARCAKDALAHGWQIISDTSWPGYEEIPRWIQAGYLTMFGEIHANNDADIDIVIVPAGVGALAAAAAWYYNRVYPEPRPKLVSVEPVGADCLLQSILSETGEPVSLKGELASIMAGLNCGTPSQVAWPFVKLGFDLFMTVTDDAAREAMRTYYYPKGEDPRIISGESGAAGLAALLTLCNESSIAAADARAHLDLSPSTKVLLLNTEGDTDPEGFKSIIS